MARRWDSGCGKIQDPLPKDTYNVTDEEKAYWNGKQDRLVYDSAPTKGSTNAVTSGVVHTAIEDRAAQTAQEYKAYFNSSQVGLQALSDAIAESVAKLQEVQEEVERKRIEVVQNGELVDQRTYAALSYQNGAADCAAAAAESAQEAFASANRVQSAVDSAIAASTAATNAATEALEAAANLESVVTRAEGAATAALESETNAKASENAAAVSKQNAKTSEDNAHNAETNAIAKATEASASATESKSYAVGGTGTRAGEATDNAKYYYNQIKALDIPQVVDDVDALKAEMSNKANTSDLEGKQDKLTPGANITIEGNTISASGGLAEVDWGSITGTLANQADLKNALDAKANVTSLSGKQDKLTPGANITIEGNVISASGGASTEDIANAVNDYLTEHPVAGGATEEEHNQIYENKDNIEEVKEDLSLITERKSSKNLFNVPDQERTTPNGSLGISIKDNIFTLTRIKDTASGSNAILDGEFTVDEDGDYTLSSVFDQAIGRSVNIYIWNFDTNAVISASTYINRQYPTRVAQLNSGVRYGYRVTISNASDFNSLFFGIVLKIQLEKGNTATDWEDPAYGEVIIKGVTDLEKRCSRIEQFLRAKFDDFDTVNYDLQMT